MAVELGADSRVPPGGAAIVYEMMIDDDRRENVAGLLMSLNLPVKTPADSDGAEFIGWEHDAGFGEARRFRYVTAQCGHPAEVTSA